MAAGWKGKNKAIPNPSHEKDQPIPLTFGDSSLIPGSANVIVDNMLGADLVENNGKCCEVPISGKLAEIRKISFGGIDSASITIAPLIDDISSDFEVESWDIDTEFVHGSVTLGSTVIVESQPV